MALTDAHLIHDYELTGQDMTGFYFNGGDHRQVMKRAARWIKEEREKRAAEQSDDRDLADFFIYDAVFGFTEDCGICLTLYVER